MKSQKTELPQPLSFVFNASFNRATTTVDGGWRVSLDLDAFQGELISQLASVRDKVLQVAIVPINKDESDVF